MRCVFKAVLAGLILSVPAAPMGAAVFFDFGTGNVQPGWFEVTNAGIGSSGPVSLTTTAVGGGVTLDNRDRGTANGGGAEMQMWRDFLFANGSNDLGEGLDITITGLTPDTTYPINLWAFDESSNGGRSATWNGTVLSFPDSPDPVSLNDYVAAFDVTTDGGGTAVLQGRVTANNGQPHHVFVNGLGIGDPGGGVTPPVPPPIVERRIDIDVGAMVTEPGWTSLPVTGNAGSVEAEGVTFTVFSADNSRDRGTPNDLTRDFVFDDGGGQAVGVTISGLPAGWWEANVWAWDEAAAAGDQIVGITRFTAGPESIFTDSFAANPTDPFTFTFNSANLPDGFGIFTRENNSANRSRFNALSLTPVAPPPPPSELKIDIDVGTPETEPGWTSLLVSGNSGTAYDQGVTFAVFSADDSRNRSGPNQLARDFVFDDGAGQATGLQIFNLPPGSYQAKVWAWDDAAAVGNQIVGITRFSAGPETIYTDSFAPDPTEPFTFRFNSWKLPDGFGIFTRENNSGDQSRFNALELTAMPTPREFKIDIDVGANETEPGFTSLEVNDNTGSVFDQGVEFVVFSADGSRDRSNPNPLTRDFIFDDGAGQAVGLQVWDLPDGVWEAKVWAWDDSFPTTVGDQIVGITQFGAGPEIIFTDSFTPSATEPFTFLFDSRDLPNGFGIFTRENNTANRARFSALQLTLVPEPSAFILAALGLLGLAWYGRRRFAR